VNGSNPANPPGRAVANRLLANVSAIWRSWHKRHGLPVSCPVERLTPGALKARDTRVANDELPDWYAKLHAKGHDGREVMSTIRRDLQLLSLFTGVRTDGVRNLRWEDVDFDDELIEITRAKGDPPYTLPMTATVREILERRQAENAASLVLAPSVVTTAMCFPRSHATARR
jgi:integrase